MLTTLAIDVLRQHLLAALPLSFGASVLSGKHGSRLFVTCWIWTCVANLDGLLQCSWSDLSSQAQATFIQSMQVVSPVRSWQQQLLLHLLMPHPSQHCLTVVSSV